VRIGALALVATLLAPAAAWADPAASSGDQVRPVPQIRITVNPEGRLSAAVEGPVPRSARCGTQVEISLAIVNQGFVTESLEAALVGTPPATARLDFPRGPLRGVPLETRTMRITLSAVGPTDMTIAFTLRNEVPDLAGRDRIHLLMRGI
jgi:hypothetical protein